MYLIHLEFKNMKMNKKILFLVLLAGAVVILPSIVMADSTLPGLVAGFAQNLSALSAGLATIAFMVSGIMFLTATGNPSRMTIAKGSLVAGVIGIVIVILAPLAQQFVISMFKL